MIKGKINTVHRQKQQAAFEVNSDCIILWL